MKARFFVSLLIISKVLATNLKIRTAKDFQNFIREFFGDIFDEDQLLDLEKKGGLVIFYNGHSPEFKIYHLLHK